MRTYKQLLLIFSLLFVVNTASADKAVFAGGCFWCMEAEFQELKGVDSVVSGFTGGKLKNPTYKGDHRGHYEAVEVSYDPAIISYQQLLDVFWVNIDPFDVQGQFCDKGPSYLSAIFVGDNSQRELAQASLVEITRKFATQKVVTPILSTSKFWPVEEYHQDYYQKNPLRYKYYRYGCRRDNRLEELWGGAATH